MLVDVSPLHAKAPVIASAVGGMPELLPPRAGFEGCDERPNDASRANTRPRCGRTRRG